LIAREVVVEFRVHAAPQTSEFFTRVLQSVHEEDATILSPDFESRGTYPEFAGVRIDRCRCAPVASTWRVGGIGRRPSRHARRLPFRPPHAPQFGRAAAAGRIVRCRNRMWSRQRGSR
jgi:hypothetical protein